MSKKQKVQHNNPSRADQKAFFFFDWIIGNYSMSFFFEQLIEFLK